MAEQATSSIVLGKRRRLVKGSNLVLHLSGGSRSSLSPVSDYALSVSNYESDATGVGTESEQPAAGGLVLINGKLVKDAKKRYNCIFEGCNKSYRKPSRLQEHERSHTGERPFTCSTCSKSYLRESHLQAHARSHLPEYVRPLTCGVDGCSRRFWTSQHLKVHQGMHSGSKPFKCSHEDCTESFVKHSQLRSHISSSHCPPGTKPFRCDHQGCDKSFSTGQKLKAHVKTHDERRYICTGPGCVKQAGHIMYFATWTALQAHTRSTHPATCPYVSCNGKTFSAQKGLRAHLKVHEQMEIEEQLAIDGGSEDESDVGEAGKGKRRRGGEIGRDWKCDVEGCVKDFKSKKALQIHVNVTHLQRRDFTCLHAECPAAFGYKHLLQRHVAKMHPVSAGQTADNAEDQEPGQPSTSIDDADVSAEASKLTIANNKMIFNIDMITGKRYLDAAQNRLTENKALQCPFPNLPSDFKVKGTQDGSGSAKDCQYVFTRAYDLRRHLRTAHGLIVDRVSVDEWVRRAKTEISAA